jgi:hypothetical protein
MRRSCDGSCTPHNAVRERGRRSAELGFGEAAKLRIPRRTVVAGGSNRSNAKLLPHCGSILISAAGSPATAMTSSRTYSSNASTSSIASTDRLPKGSRNAKAPQPRPSHSKTTKHWFHLKFPWPRSLTFILPTSMIAMAHPAAPLCGSTPF